MINVLTKVYGEPPVCEKEILRYAGAKTADEATNALMKSCLNETRGIFTYKICYCITDVTVSEELCDFSLFSVKSKSLAKNLVGCQSAVIFAATVGIALDRLISKYTRISPSRALMLQAIGAERIEALCDAFSKDIENMLSANLRPRYSAGYGDTPIEVQRDIFRVLDASRKIGISLGDSMLMSPTKSVTAFIGIEK
jgi:hypothetical protein